MAEEDALKVFKGVIYVGHLPHGFQEKQLRGFFSQYGKILHVRLARSKRTGNPKGYAFVQFEDRVIAEIAAKAMNGYHLFKHRLVVKLLSKEQVHSKTFQRVNADKRGWLNKKRIFANHFNQPKTLEEYEKSVARREEKRRRQAKKLEDMGIEYTYINDSASAVEVKPQAKPAKKKRRKKKPSK